MKLDLKKFDLKKLMPKQSEAKLEEKLLRKKLDLYRLKGEKLYFAMNDGYTYTGTFIGSNYYLHLKDVEILGKATKFGYIALKVESISTWWPEDSYKKKSRGKRR